MYVHPLHTRTVVQTLFEIVLRKLQCGNYKLNVGCFRSSNIVECISEARQDIRRLLAMDVLPEGWTFSENKGGSEEERI